MLHVPVSSMAAPIRDTQGKAIGVLAGVVDLSKPNFLDKITDNHYGKTGGYTLVVPQHRVIVTGKSHIMEQLPTSGVSPLIDHFIPFQKG